MIKTFKTKIISIFTCSIQVYSKFKASFEFITDVYLFFSELHFTDVLKMHFEF